MQVISFLSATAFFLSSFAGHSMAAPADSASAGSDETVGILIAITPYFAYNCPNNCNHKDGSSCKYYSGPSNTSAVISGKCTRLPNQPLIWITEATLEV
ncbi:hypothetical protein V2G26_012624 [Clonostachys chloroleuca]